MWSSCRRAAPLSAAKSKTEASISSKLKVKLAEVGAELGSATKQSAEYVLYQPVIEAFNVQRADPAWELRAAAWQASQWNSTLSHGDQDAEARRMPRLG